MAGSTLTTLDSVLKEWYTGQRVESMMPDDFPFFSMLKKVPRFPGRNLPIPFKYANPQGRSATFSNAQGNATAASNEQFTLTRVRNYGVATLDSDSILATGSDAGNFAGGSAMKQQIDGQYEQLVRDLALAVYRSRAQPRGVVATSGITTTSLTLDNINDATNFEVNQEAVGAAAEASGALRDSGNSATVTGINTDTGVLTTDSNWTSQISGLTDADTLFIEGDRTTASMTLGIAGLESWIPGTAPDSTAYFGVDRTTHLSRLSGNRVTGTSLTVEEAWIQGLAQAASASPARPRTGFCHPKQFRELVKSMGSKTQYVDTAGGNGKVGFRGVEILGGVQRCTVYPDMSCPSNVLWLLDMSTWTLYGEKGIPHLADEDGLRIRASATADEYEVRWRFFGNMACTFPGANVRISVTNVT